MKFRIAYLLFAAALLVSCERKLRAPDVNGSSTSGLIGNWKFVSTAGTTIASSEIDLFGIKTRAENALTYTSANPKGFYQITATEIKGNGIGYDFNGTLNIKLFENNVLQSEVTNPFPTSTIAPVNNSTGYKVISADSLAFTTNPPGVQLPNGGTLSSPGGCKYKIEGKKLTMFIKYTSSTTGSSGGIPTADKQKIDVNLVLEKQ